MWHAQKSRYKIRRGEVIKYFLYLCLIKLDYPVNIQLMEKFNEYIATLHSGLSLLALPFNNTFKAYAAPDGTLYSLTKRELNKMSFILPFDGGNFADTLNSYNEKCIYLTVQCKRLNPESVFHDERLPPFLSVVIKSCAQLEGVSPLDITVFELLWKRYFKIIDGIQDFRLKCEYNDFLINWQNLYDIAFQKRDALLKRIDCLSNNNEAAIENEVEGGALSSNEEEALVFPKIFSLNSADMLYSGLLKDKFIDPSTMKEDFYCVFSLSTHKGRFNPVKWIKENRDVKNGKINKSALVELLTLLGYTQQEIIGEDGKKYKRMNNCFKIESTAFKANDFPARIKGKGVSVPLNVKSEFHEDLVRLLEEIDLPRRRKYIV